MISKIILTIVFSCLSTLVFLGCKTQGCTESTAVNFDSSADEEDFSCRYWEDEYEGWYTVTDTSEYPNLLDGGLIIVYRTYQFEIVYNNLHNTVVLKGFDADCDAIASLSATGIHLQQANLYGMTNVVFNGDSQSFTFSFDRTIGQTKYKHGRAIRQ